MPVKDDTVAGKIIEELTHGKYIFVAEYTHVKITSCKRQKNRAKNLFAICIGIGR